MKIHLTLAITLAAVFAFPFQLALAQSSDSITVSAVGDIMLGTTYPADWLPADQGRAFFREAAPYIRASDIRFGNFEGTFFEGRTQSDGKTPGPNRYLFRTPLDYVERLVEGGFNVMSLSNNHAWDFGSAGIESTKQTLQLAGIQYSTKDGSVARFYVRGIRVALIAVDYYKGLRSVVMPNTTYSEIAELKKETDIVIVSAHVGREGPSAIHVQPGEEFFIGENRGDSVRFARKAIDHGADLILMHGPHVPRAMEIYRNRLVVYSLGNFATGRGIDIGGISGLAPLVKVELNRQGHFLKGQIVSFAQFRPEETALDPKKRSLSLINRLSQEDFPSSAPSFSAHGFFGFQQ